MLVLYCYVGNEELEWGDMINVGYEDLMSIIWGFVFWSFIFYVGVKFFFVWSIIVRVNRVIEIIVGIFFRRIEVRFGFMILFIVSVIEWFCLLLGLGICFVDIY